MLLVPLSGFQITQSIAMNNVSAHQLPNTETSYYTLNFGFVCWVLWHVKHCRLFTTQSSLYYISNTYYLSGISTIVGYLIPNRLYTYISNSYDLVSFVLWHINHCRLFNAKSSLCIYIYNIYDLVCLGFMTYQPL